MSATAYIALGANIGDAAEVLKKALLDLILLPNTKLLAQSSLYKSPPFGIMADGPDYFNAVACISTSLTPYDLLYVLHDLEQKYGRERLYQNAPRTLDLDILLYGDEVLNDESLILPHPRMTERAFVLLPLSELNANLQWSDGSGTRVLSELLSGISGQSILRVDTD